MSIPAQDPAAEQFPKLTPAYEEAARAEARTEIAGAISQLDLLARARVSLGMLAFAATLDEFYFLQNGFDELSIWRWENAGTHAKFATTHLFDAYADACWQTVRPDTRKFLGFLGPVHVRVDREIKDISQQLESIFGIPAIVERDCGDKIQRVLDEKHAEWAERARFEGAVTDRKHWSQLQENFEALANRESHERPEHFLTAVGEYTASLHPTGTWILSGAERSLRTKFELYGVEAGVALKAPSGVDPLTFFLHHLFRDSLVSRNRQAAGDTRKGGYIRQVCPAAAMFCTKLQKIAMENDHRAAIPEAQPRPAPVATGPDEGGSKTPKLNVDLIGKWIDDEGCDNKELAGLLKISARAVSSLRNNGHYHGREAVIKLANLMKLNVEDLYLP